MKITFLALLTFLYFTAFPAAGYAADDAKSRMDAAIAYEKVTPVGDMMESMLAELEKNPQLALSAEEMKIMRDSIDATAVRKQMLDAMVKHFTTAEIESMTTFYSSPEGKSITAKMPAYMNEFMPFIQEQVGAVVQKTLESRAAQ